MVRCGPLLSLDKNHTAHVSQQHIVHLDTSLTCALVFASGPTTLPGTVLSPDGLSNTAISSSLYITVSSPLFSTAPLLLSSVVASSGAAAAGAATAEADTSSPPTSTPVAIPSSDMLNRYCCCCCRLGRIRQSVNQQPPHGAPEGVLYRFGGISVFLYPVYPCPLSIVVDARSKVRKHFCRREATLTPPLTTNIRTRSSCYSLLPRGSCGLLETHIQARVTFLLELVSKSLIHPLPLDWTTSSCFSEVPLDKNERPDRQGGAGGVRNLRRSRSGSYFLEQGVLLRPHPEPSRFAGLTWN